MSQTQTTEYAIQPAQAEQLLHALVATPSLSYQEANAVGLLVGWMRNHGYDDAFVDASGSAVGIVGSGDGSRDIVLLGHIDTFAGNPPVYIEGRKLYGRGSVDAKGPLCSFAVAALNARAHLPEGVRLIVVGAVEEEAASSKGARHAATVYQPRYCLIGEPSHWDRITLGYKGRLLIEWRWEGGRSHSAGHNATAAEHAFAYWERVQAYLNEVNAERGASIFNVLDATIRDINTGVFHEGTHEWCRMTIGFRLPPDMTPAQIVAGLAAQMDGETVRPYGEELTYTAEKDNALTRAMRGAIREQGGTPRFVYKTGTSDMNAVGPIWRCPMIAYGPGDSTLDHTPEEHIELDEYGQAVRVLTGALIRLAGEL